MRHFTMNQYLEFTGPTTARYHYYHQTVFGTGGATLPGSCAYRGGRQWRG